ncbi:phosphotransferase [Myxococcota bacterium]|nr:phosphotransferase [Myxococcota bacterium]
MTVRPDDPVLRDVSAVRVLSGLSGAQIYLVSRDERVWFVRKAARHAQGSARLRAQAAKQQRFDGLARPHLKTPRILGDGEVDGRYYFDMELVRGPDGASYLGRAPFDAVVAFTDRLCGYLELAASTPAIGVHDGTGPFDALYAKLCDVERRTRALSPDVLSALFLGLDRLRAIGAIPATLCHGDLTLENMAIGEDGTIWVLDLLDSPVEHWWQDVAKLHQDLSGGWYLRRQQRVALGVMMYVSGRLLDSAAKLSPAYRDLHATLVACTFVRILPYVQSDDERRFVLDRIEHFARSP